MHRQLLIIVAVASLGCDSKKRTPSPPPVPDVALPDFGQAAVGEPDAGMPSSIAARLGDAGPSAPLKDPLAPIAPNLIEFVPEMLAGVKARRRQIVKTAPIVHGFYKGDRGRIYNLHITGPHKSEAERREMYPLLGKDDRKKSGPVEIEGFRIGEFEGQRTYHSGEEKSEAVVLVNPFVEVKLSVAPTKKRDEAVKLLDEIDLDGVSKLR